MTPKEKAIELFDGFYQRLPLEENVMKECGYDIWHEAKQCALIAVDEIIDAIDWHEFEVPNMQLKFWFNVKKVIENL